MHYRYCSFFIILLATVVHGFSQERVSNYDIKTDGNTFTIRAGILTRKIKIDQEGISMVDLLVNHQTILAGPVNETAFCLYKAFPNCKPKGIDQSYGQSINQVATEQNKTDALNIVGSNKVKQEVLWTDSVKLNSVKWAPIFDKPVSIISNPTKEKTRLVIRSRCTGSDYKGLTVTVVYEIHQGFPGIKKWIELSNNSGQWMKIDQLVIDDISVRENFATITDLTPSESGAVSSIRGFSNKDKSTGIIAVSEVPSALRTLESKGRMGYSGYFEWVLGPAERFVSEPVYIYAFDGASVPTASAISTELDRTIENSFKKYLYQVVEILPFEANRTSPVWCTWSNFAALINDKNIREMADIASEAGMKTMLLDAGWAAAETPATSIPIGTEPDSTKFPDFKGTCDYIAGKNLKLGLWVTCFRHPGLSADFKVFPNGNSLPKIKRESGLAMSFASNWRYFYANDLLRLRDKYNATYFKQDLTNVKFGDIAEGHDSRTLKESILRGLRGLLETQDLIRQASPDVTVELTHEIYWGTPGTPCDIAALKHANTFHVPPNDYAGAGHTKQRVNPEWDKNPNFQPGKLNELLNLGCWNARRRVFAYRGLPLQCIEYYGAATVNFKGSLTSQVQQRQICSWLMGAPNVFAGDLASLTTENRRVYRQGFQLIERLDKDYGIYRNFQYSGVPEPTDTEWHWWGKLNDQGYGAVVVIRGKEGTNQKKINIPWVHKDMKYKLRLCFSGKELGLISGKNLIAGNLELELDKNSQEIIEIMPAR